jgi:hypothetical protein
MMQYHNGRPNNHNGIYDYTDEARKISKKYIGKQNIMAVRCWKAGIPESNWFDEYPDQKLVKEIKTAFIESDRPVVVLGWDPFDVSRLIWNVLRIDPPWKPIFYSWSWLIDQFKFGGKVPIYYEAKAQAISTICGLENVKEDQVAGFIDWIQNQRNSMGWKNFLIGIMDFSEKNSSKYASIRWLFENSQVFALPPVPDDLWERFEEKRIDAYEKVYEKGIKEKVATKGCI